MAEQLTRSDHLLEDALDVRHADGAFGADAGGAERTAARLRQLWTGRRLILRIAVAGLVLSTLIAYLIPKRYVSTARLMPPDQANSSVAMLAAAAAGQAGSSLGNVASDLLGMKSSGALFIGILQSRTVQDDLIDKFSLRKIYSDREYMDARRDLSGNTDISEDRKSGIITVEVTDGDLHLAAAMAGEYVEELNRVVTDVNTSSAHRERIFLEDRLAQVKGDLESAEKSFGEFASKNTAIDIQAQGKAMIEAAGALEGQMIAAETQRQGLKQIYSDDNVRVRAAQARVEELQRQLQRIGGKYDAPGGASSQSGNSDSAPGDLGNSVYPSIRQLPLLGVSYADLYERATPVLVDVDRRTFNIDAAKIEERITPKTKAIIPVHMAGQTCDMDEIMAIAKRHKLVVIEDCAHAVGAKYEEKHAGTIGDAGCFSFYASKNLVTGDGGMITARGDQLADFARVISLHGMSTTAWKRYTKEGASHWDLIYPGFKYNMTDIEASLGIHQLRKIEQITTLRQKWASRYDELLADIPGITLPYRASGRRHANHLYIVTLDVDRLNVTRDKFMEMLKAENVGCGIHFVSVHMQPYYRERFGYETNSYPNAAWLSERILSLPLFPQMTETDVQDVARAVRKIISRSFKS